MALILSPEKQILIAESFVKATSPRIIDDLEWPPRTAILDPMSAFSLTRIFFGGGISHTYPSLTDWPDEQRVLPSDTAPTWISLRQ